MAELRLTATELLEKEWRAQFNNLIGGCCITLDEDPRTPADGAQLIADFMTMDMAVHVVELHNRELSRIGRSELGRRIREQRKSRDE